MKANVRAVLHAATLPFRVLLSLPLLVGFLLVGWLYLREVRKRRGR